MFPDVVATVPISLHYAHWLEVRGGTVSWSNALQARRSWVRIPIGSMEFDLNLLATLWPWGQLSH